MTKDKNWWELTPEDFPPGEPVLKQKRGLWYRDDNSGYTDRVTEAGLYEREAAIRYCFKADGKNGHCDVIAVPVRLALGGYTVKELEAKREKIEKLIPFAIVSDKPGMTVF
jgi:hypothetical protein